jgi:hypothetical protein
VRISVKGLKRADRRRSLFQPLEGMVVVFTPPLAIRLSVPQSNAVHAAFSFAVRFPAAKASAHSGCPFFFMAITGSVTYASCPRRQHMRPRYRVQLSRRRYLALLHD